MTLQPALAYLKEQLLTINGIEHVYFALPFVKGISEIKMAFESSILSEKSLHAVELTNISGEEHDDDSGNSLRWHDTLQIQFFLLFDGDSSALCFQRWLDAFKTLLHDDQTLHQTVLSRQLLRLVKNEPVWFYDRLCHHAIYQLPVIAELC